MEPDFSGWATKAGLKCSDGRVIMPTAFQHQDGVTVPLVWQHGHNDPDNVLGHAVLKWTPDGVRADAFFNSTAKGQSAKALVQHRDITMLSIHANQLVEKGKQVLHGMIREVSLVLAGANPGAIIDNVALRHADGEIELLNDEAIIHTGLEFGDVEESVEHADNTADGPTAQEIYDSMTDEQKTVVHYIVEQALLHDDMEDDSSADQGGDSDTTTDNSDEDTLEHKEGNDDMGKRNVFESSEDTKTPGVTISHDDLKGIVENAKRGGSLKAAMEDYALQHGIEDIDLLFPDAKNISNTPEWNKRRTEWVAGVLSGVRHSPFSRIKTMSADITLDEARAKGYVKGNMKKEEWFGLSKRVTTPTTIYKKQKLDRDDIIDITDLDVVAWLKGEMRLMLEEELARAILFGDGRAADDEDKIPDGRVSDAAIRAIAYEAEPYTTTFYVEADITAWDLVDTVLEQRRYYKGTGVPTFYTTTPFLTKLITARDTLNRRIWRTVDELAAELRVDRIVEVEAMESESDLLGIFVNLQDYTVGADKGGEVSMFDDFDIDYNQFKYLIETRLSGALTKLQSALIMREVSASATLATPTEPGFDSSTGVVTIPSVTGVVYKDASNATVTAGAKSAIAAGASVTYHAVPASGYYFVNNENDEWTFTRDA